VLALGESLAITLVLDSEPCNSAKVSELLGVLSDFLKSGHLTVPEDYLDRAILFSLMYGGALLVKLKGNSAPISRYLPEKSVVLEKCIDKTNSLRLTDREILELWSTLVTGDENLFFETITKYCLVFPENYRISPGGSLTVSPVGFIQVGEAEG
jgi:hypothetical protein